MKWIQIGKWASFQEGGEKKKFHDLGGGQKKLNHKKGPSGKGRETDQARPLKLINISGIIDIKN